MQSNRRRRIGQRLVLTLVAWGVAWPIAIAVLTTLHAPLASLSPVLRALVVSGVLVVVMVNLVMPALTRLITRWPSGARTSTRTEPSRKPLEHA